MRFAFLLAQVDALAGALKDLSAMYAHAWDLVDGGLMMMGTSIPKFEKAHKAAYKALTDAGYVP